MPRAEIESARTIAAATRIAGELAVPGDKSIAHRALILASLAQGESWIHGLPEGEDVLATLACLRGLGANIQRSGRTARIRGAGLSSFATPHGDLDCANSGTTMRLLLGVLAGSSISATLDGDASLRRRPMDRVIEPLRSMGARIESRESRAPLFVVGGALQGRRHALAIPSAQVKSALLLAGLSASGPTTVVEATPTRDHTERLLRAMGTDVGATGDGVVVRPSHQPLRPIELAIPGDFSSAAFWMAAPASSASRRATGSPPWRMAFAAWVPSWKSTRTASGSRDRAPCRARPSSPAGITASPWRWRWRRSSRPVRPRSRTRTVLPSPIRTSFPNSRSSAMNRVLLLGDPVSRSLSPAMQNAAFEALGIDCQYALRELSPTELAGAMSDLRSDERILGANVTIPHKEPVIAFLSELDPLAARRRAVHPLSR